MASNSAGLERVVGLVNKLQQICSSLGETALTENAVLWNKLTTIVVVGGQVSSCSYKGSLHWLAFRKRSLARTSMLTCADALLLFLTIELWQVISA